MVSRMTHGQQVSQATFFLTVFKIWNTQLEFEQRIVRERREKDILQATLARYLQIYGPLGSFTTTPSQELSNGNPSRLPQQQILLGECEAPKLDPSQVVPNVSSAVDPSALVLSSDSSGRVDPSALGLSSDSSGRSAAALAASGTAEADRLLSQIQQVFSSTLNLF